MTPSKTDTEERERNIVKHPGGVLLHHADGLVEYHGYGEEVDPDQLADYQRDLLHLHTDSKDRSAYARDFQEHQAHKQAAFADAGQVNSTSDAVPGNYGELSEEEASQLVGNIQDLNIQARLLLHERLNHGSRQMVVDAASPTAVALAEVLFNQIEEGHLGHRGTARFDQTPVFDRERQIERDAKAQERSSKSAKSAQRSSGGDTPPPNGDS